MFCGRMCTVGGVLHGHSGVLCVCGVFCFYVRAVVWLGKLT